RQVAVAEPDVEFNVGEPGFGEALEGKAVFRAAAMKRIVEAQHPSRRLPGRGQPAQELPPPRPAADQAESPPGGRGGRKRRLHWAATKPRYLNRFRDTGMARCRAASTAVAWRKSSSRGASPLLIRNPSPRNQW